MSGRVLYLIPTMGSGGAERQLVVLASALPSCGWEVDTSVVHGGVHLAALAATGATIHRPRVASNYDPRLLRELARIIRDRKPDVVQTWLPQMDIAGGLVARWLGVPWVVSERSSRTLHDAHAKRLLRDAVVHHATAVISNSQEGLRHWARRHPAVPRHCVGNALALEKFDAAAPAPEALALRNGGRTAVVLAVGRLIESKRFDTFIDVMKRVTAETDAVGVICGDGALDASLRDYARQAGIADRIVFAGFIADIAGWIKAADVLVGLSEHEGRPNAIIEAMACRTPLVVVDIPEYREAVDESTARIVPRDEARIAAAILEVLRDRESAASRAGRAREAAGHWSVHAIAEQHAAIYDALAHRK
jgi:glycosyltransferase involved in cell wall biosynthesis